MYGMARISTTLRRQRSPFAQGARDSDSQRAPAPQSWSGSPTVEAPALGAGQWGFESLPDYVTGRDKKDYVCTCTGICGVRRTYDQIWYDYEAKYRGTPGLAEWDLKSIHARWKSIGSQAAKGAIKNMTGV